MGITKLALKYAVGRIDLMKYDRYLFRQELRLQGLQEWERLSASLSVRMEDSAQIR